jgi:hypothetical protein
MDFQSVGINSPWAVARCSCCIMTLTIYDPSKMKDESNAVKEAVARGKQRFFAHYPELLQEVDVQVEKEAAAGGKSVDELRQLAMYRAIARAAKAVHKDSLELLLKLGADSPEQYDQLIAAQNNQIKKTIGL